MIEFFFDCSSPWTYLAFHNVQPMAADIGVDIQWRPILVGGVFNAVNPSVYAQRDNPVPAKQRHMQKDIQDWARISGLAITMPPSVFPVNSVKAMRGCVWLSDRPDHMLRFARAVFEAYWGCDLDIANDRVLADICHRCGIAPEALALGIAQPAVKDQLKANGDELVLRGGFGSPTLFVGDDMYFGNDRLALVRAAALRQKTDR